MKSTFLTMFVAAYSTTLAGASDQTGAGALQIQVYDYANIEQVALDRLLSSTHEILATAGIPVQVSLCRGQGAVSCESAEPQTQPLVVRIVPGYAKTSSNARREPLGQSYAGHDGGSVASIFLAPAREQAAAVNVPWLTVLSYAAAHEIGHLLLGDQAHTSRGVMKAHWDRADYMAMSQNQCHFTNEQARILAARFGAPAIARNAK